MSLFDQWVLNWVSRSLFSIKAKTRKEKGEPPPPNLIPYSIFSLPPLYTLKECESESEVTQSCPTLCDPMDCSLPGTSVHGILQARVLKWVAISFSRGSS